MIPLLLRSDGPLTALAIGAHPDDVEIGAGGTLMSLAEAPRALRLHVLVMTGSPERALEARAAARALVAGSEVAVETHDLPDGHLPARWSELKSILEVTASRVQPDVVLGPSPDDAHQDHRTVAEMLPTVFRDHLVLRYEIPKWDGDLGAGRPTHYVPLSPEIMARKTAVLMEHFPSQRNRDWFSPATFESLARLRGMECRSPFAEAFSVGKAVLDLRPR